MSELRSSISAIKKYRNCKREYFYSLVEGIETKRPPVYLRRGNWFHANIEAFYRGGDWREEHARQLKQWKKLFLEEREFYGPDLPETVEQMTESYLYHYRDEHANWEILAVEETYEGKVGEFTINIKIDLLIREKKTGRTWVVDHKTSQSIPSAEWRLTDLQSAIYVHILRQNGIEVHGFIFNYIRAKAPTVPKVNKDGSISRARIDTDFRTMAKFFLEYYEVEKLSELPAGARNRLKTLKATPNPYFRRVKIVKDERVVQRQIEEMVITLEEMDHTFEMAETLGEKVWVRNVTPSCERFCTFYDLCSAELMNSNPVFVRRHKYQASKYTEGRNLGRQQTRKAAGKNPVKSRSGN